MQALRNEAERIVRALRDQGHEAYFAGGCVRDMVMGLTPHDYDVATSAAPEIVRALFPRTNDVGAHFGVILVHTPHGDIEVATFRTEGAYSDGRHPDAVRFSSARDDVLRRDFTINGMLFDPVAGCVIDWVEGQADVRRKVIRTIGDPERRFEEDKLRLLRAVRFACRLDFAIEPETYRAICREAPRLVQVSPERIRDELLRILTGPRAGRGLRLLHDCGLLAPVLPEVEAMAGVEQPPEFHPEGDVLEHTALMLDLASNPSPELAMGVLLHDVGKPGTQTFRERIRFDEHDQHGEALARIICRRLRFSNDQTDQICAFVGHHMRMVHACDMRLGKLKALLALPRFDEHLELHRLDCAASHGKTDVYDFLRRKQSEMSIEEIRPRPLITGADLIAMGHAPGPLFRQALDAVREEQLEGRLTDADQARAWVRERFPPPA